MILGLARQSTCSVVVNDLLHNFADEMSRDTLERQSRSFHEKKVVRLQCKYCDNCLSARGMKANLLADTTVELFSTDSPMVG